MKFKIDDIVKYTGFGYKSQINQLYKVEELLKVMDFFINDQKVIDSKIVPGARLSELIPSGKKFESHAPLKDLQLVQRP